MRDNEGVAILSSGFEVAKRREPVGPLPVPEGLKASAVIGHAGSIQLDWKHVRGASSYIVQMTTTDPTLPSTVWEEVGFPVKSRFLVNGLISGNSYWFRVMAVGAAGVGGETAAISQRAL